MRLRSLIRKLTALNRRDRLDLLPATLAIVLARLRLRLRPFPRALAWADAPSADEPQGPALLDPHTQRRIRALERVGHRLFPRNPCLTEALVVHRLLRRKGYPSELRIGVRKASRSDLEAHAWVEHQGVVVIGARGLSAEHVPLPPVVVSSLASKIPKGKASNAV